MKSGNSLFFFTEKLKEYHHSRGMEVIELATSFFSEKFPEIFLVVKWEKQIGHSELKDRCHQLQGNLLWPPGRSL